MHPLILLSYPEEFPSLKEQNARTSLLLFSSIDRVTTDQTDALGKMLHKTVTVDLSAMASGKPPSFPFPFRGDINDGSIDRTYSELP